MGADSRRLAAVSGVALMTNARLLPDDDEPYIADAGVGARVMSAGGLVFRRAEADSDADADADVDAGSDAGGPGEAGGRVETLLCGRIRAGCGDGNGRKGDASMSWRLPKGTPEPGESVAETARREVQEETGVSVRVLAPITSIRYFFVGHDDGVRYDKTVHFYLMKPLGGSTANHDGEFDVVEWHRYEDALALLEYDNERSVLETARALIDDF